MRRQILMLYCYATTSLVTPPPPTLYVHVATMPSLKILRGFAVGGWVVARYVAPVRPSAARRRYARICRRFAKNAVEGRQSGIARVLRRCVCRYSSFRRRKRPRAHACRQQQAGEGSESCSCEAGRAGSARQCCTRTVNHNRQARTISNECRERRAVLKATPCTVRRLTYVKVLEAAWGARLPLYAAGCASLRVVYI